MPISLNGTDIANRIRRFTKAVGAISNAMVDPIGGTIALADLTQDPYQSESQSFAWTQAQGAVAAQSSYVWIVGNAPVTLIDAIGFRLAAAGQALIIQLQRPETAGLGSAFTGLNGAPLNGGGQGKALSAVAQARFGGTTAVAAPSGQTIEQGWITPDANSHQYLILPRPIVLYGPPFNGQQPGSGVGDACVFTNNTQNSGLSVTVWFREFPNFTPQ